MVAGWKSIAHTLVEFMQGVSPSLTSAQAVPGQDRNAIIPSGRGQGRRRVRRLHDRRHARPPAPLRRWQRGGRLAARRHGQGTFEPIQRLEPNAFSLYRVSGDGRLGPLDLLVDEIPAAKGTTPPPGEYYAHVLPLLSAKVKVTKVKKKGKVVAHKVTVTVTDAGDAVAAATVHLAGKKHKTNKSGKATLVIPGAGGGRRTLTVTDGGYQTLKLRVKL